MVYFRPQLGIMPLDLRHLPEAVGHFRVDLAATKARIDRRQEIRDGFATFTDHFQNYQQSNQTRVRIPVVTEIKVPRVFATEDGIVLAHLGFYKRVPHSCTDCVTAPSYNHFWYAPRTDKVV